VLDRAFIKRNVASLSLFHDLAESELDAVARACRPVAFADGARIVRQGDAGDDFFIIKAGKVRFAMSFDDGGGGEEEDIGELVQGQFFGEGALLTDKPRRASAYASSKCELWALSASDFAAAFDAHANANEDGSGGGGLRAVRARLRADFARRRHARERGDARDLKLDQLRKVRSLGEGSFGPVTLVRRQSLSGEEGEEGEGGDEEGAVFALRALDKELVVASEAEDRVVTERALLVRLNHPCLCNLHHTFQDRASVFMLVDLADGGDLRALVRDRGRHGLRRAWAAYFLASAVLALEYLHSRGVVHRDVRPKSLRLTARGAVKLARFGVAKKLRADVDGGRAFTLCGTPAYAAPEIYKCAGHGLAADWWSFGVCVHELLCGYVPFGGATPPDVFRTLLTFEHCYPSVAFPAAIQHDDGAARLLLALLQPDPLYRLGALRGRAGAVKAHPFFAGFPWKALTDGVMAPPFVPDAAAPGDDAVGTAAAAAEEEGRADAAAASAEVLGNGASSYLVKYQSSTEFAWAKHF